MSMNRDLRTGCLVLVGGSGSGKSMLIEQGLLQQFPGKFAFMVDTTTRQLRATETADAKDKRFVSRSKFAEMIYQHEFANWFKNCINDEYYGVEWRILFDAFANGRLLITTIDSSNVEAAVKPLKAFSPVVVWIRPKNLELLEARLRSAGRGTAAEQELEGRLRANREGHAACLELQKRGFFDHVVTNDVLEHALEDITALGQNLRPLRLGCLRLARPLRPLLLPMLGHSQMWVLWLTKGAAFCDRPRLLEHIGKAEMAKHRSRHYLDGIPVAGDKPSLARWLILACGPHLIGWLSGSTTFFGGPLGASPWRMLGTWTFRLSIGALVLASAGGAIVGACWQGRQPVPVALRRFRLSDTSLPHFCVRWLGPVPVFLALAATEPELRNRLLFLQGASLAAHIAIKGFFETFLRSVDPSGHMRVATNTAVYLGWAATADPIRLRVSSQAWTACGLWMAAQAFSVFQSAAMHHSAADMVLGMLLAWPQLALLGVWTQMLEHRP